MPQMTEDQIQEILDGAIEKIKEGVITDAMRGATWKVQEALNREVDKLVTDFVTKEIAPELIINLSANKSAIIEAGIISADAMAKNLSDCLADTLAKKLSSSYERGKIMKALFGD